MAFAFPGSARSVMGSICRNGRVFITFGVLHNRFPVFLLCFYQLSHALENFFLLVKLLNAGICISGIRLASGGVNLQKWTSSRFWSISAQYSTVQYSTVQYSTVQYSTVQYSTVQYSTVQYSTVQYSTVQYNTVQYSTVQYSTVQYSTVQYSTVQYSTVQYSTVQYSTVQYSTVQYSTVQYSTVQYSTVQYSTVQYSTVQYSTVQYSTVQLAKKNVENHFFCQFRDIPASCGPSLSNLYLCMPTT